MLVDNACGGTIADKRATEAFDILDKIAQNSQQRTSNVRKGGRIDVGPDVQVQIQMARMNKELQSVKDLLLGKSRTSIGANQVMREFDRGEGQLGQEEEVQAFRDFQRPRNDLYSNTYNPGLRNHSNLS